MKVKMTKAQPMQQVQLRLPVDVREKAREIAKQQSSEHVRFYESDVYRTAIALFFESNFTDSKG